MYSLLKMGIFHCYVSLPEGTFFLRSHFPCLVDSWGLHQSFSFTWSCGTHHGMGTRDFWECQTEGVVPNSSEKTWVFGWGGGVEKSVILLETNIFFWQLMVGRWHFPLKGGWATFVSGRLVVLAVFLFQVFGDSPSHERDFCGTWLELHPALVLLSC